MSAPSAASAATSRRRLLGRENSTIGVIPSASSSLLTPLATSRAEWAARTTACAVSAMLLVVGERFLGRGYCALEPRVHFDGFAERARGAFEARLDDVVRILAVQILDMQADAG